MFIRQVSDHSISPIPFISVCGTTELGTEQGSVNLVMNSKGADRILKANFYPKNRVQTIFKRSFFIFLNLTEYLSLY